MKRGRAYTWIPLYRDKWLWGSTRLELEPAERAFFIDLLLLAGGDDGLVQANEEIGYSPSRLAGMLLYDVAVVESTIEKCVKYGKVERLGNDILRIVNWEAYSLSIPHKKKIMARKIQNDIHEDIVSHPLYKSKSMSKSKFKSESKTPKTIPSPSEFDMKMVDVLIYLMSKNNPSTKAARMNVLQRSRWAEDFRKMREVDKYPEIDIEAVVRFTQEDSFWKTNILSPGGIRKRFEQLSLKAIEAKSRGTSKPGRFAAPSAGAAAEAWADKKKRGE